MFESAVINSDWNTPGFSTYDDLELCGFGGDMGFHETIPDIFQTHQHRMYTSVPGDFQAFLPQETNELLSLSSPGDSGVDLCELTLHQPTSGSPYQDYTSSSSPCSSSSPVEFPSWQQSDNSTIGVNYHVHNDSFQTNFTDSRKRPINEHISANTLMPNVPGYFYISPLSADHTGSKPKRRRVQNPRQRKAANVRERKRMFSLNEAFDSLKHRVPTFSYEKRLSRIETLRLAITYISFMSDVVEGKKPNEINLKTSGDSCDSRSSDDSFTLEDLQLLKKSISSTLTSEDTESSDSCSSSS